MINLLKKVFSRRPGVDFKSLLNSGAVIVDVRTPGEFKTGHIKGAINIPLDQIKSKVAELKKKNKPVITCCRSGARSGAAKNILVASGIESYNGGAWDSLNSKL